MSLAEPADVTPSSRTLDASTLLFLLAALIFLYACLFVPTFLPTGAHAMDYLIFVAEGKRMCAGEGIYRDFFEFLTPGAPLVYFLLFKVFGPRLWIPDVTLLLLGLGLAWFSLLIAKKLMRPGLALLPAAIFLAGVYRNQLDPTHHWFSLLTAMAALALWMERRTPARIAAAGFLCGLTACFTQSRGVVVTAGFAAFLWWESRRRQEPWRTWLKKEAGLVAGYLAALIAVNAYFLWEAGPARFFWCTTVFVVKYWPKHYGGRFFLPIPAGLPKFISLPHLISGSVEWLFLFAVIPFVQVLFFARYGWESGEKPTEFWERPMLLGIVGFFMLLSVANSPTDIRVYTSELPGILLLGWFLDSPRKFARAFKLALAAGVLLVAPHAVVTAQSTERQILVTPQGKLAIAAPDAFEECTWVQLHTRPGDYFYEAAWSTTYSYLDVRNPTPLPFLTNTGFTTAGQVAEVIRGLEQHHVRYILWSPLELDTIPPGMLPAEDHLGPLRDYLHRHYQLVKTLRDSDGIWERSK